MTDLNCDSTGDGSNSSVVYRFYLRVYL
jgi:hypothetical protein